MKSVIKGAALFVALTCLVWIAVLWHWRATQRDMDVGDIVLYLGLLPVAAFGLVLAVRWAVGGALAKQDARAAAVSPKTPGAPAPAPAKAAADVRPALAWHLLGAWMNVPGGTNAAEFLAAIEAGKPRPRPDTALRDDEGLPVMCARVAGIDTDAVSADLARAASTAATPDVATAPRAIRALACLAQPLAEFALAVNEWATHLSVADDEQAQREPRFARVLAAWPADWDDATCVAAQEWLATRLCEPTRATLTRAQWSIRGQRMTGTELLAAGERVLDALQRQGRDDPVVLLACHSDLDLAGIRQLERDQQLFHSERRPKASMPGEGAALLSLSAVAWPADVVASSSRVRFDSPAIVRRSQSVDTPGRTASDDAERLVEHSLASARLDGVAIAKLACDADQHTPRATELFAVTIALLPGLDATEDLRLAGTISGRLGAVAPLVTLAMAAHQAAEAGKPAVALSLADTHWRMAAVVRPDTYSPAAEPA